MSAAFDVAVVGAGPAGACCALHLARGGARVALLEKAALPRPKVCGGGVVARARAHLPADVELPVERACRRVELRFGGLRFVVERATPIVELAMRADLDRALAEAAARAGAELVERCEVTALDRAGDGLALATSRGPFLALCAVGADGVHSAVARLAGWDRALPAIPALEAEVEVDPARLGERADVPVFEFGRVPQGYAWTFPKRAHISAGVLTVERGRPGLREELARYLASLGLAGADFQARGWLIPTRPRAGGCARAGVLLAGDAAGLVDPVTAEGISLALWSGRLAAQAILAHARDPQAAGAAYERALSREILGELRVARALAHLLYRRPRAARALFERAGAPLAQVMADVVAGQAGYRTLVTSPGNWARLVARALRGGARRDRLAARSRP
jgi:geranylgeranyl reductase family protein